MRDILKDKRGDTIFMIIFIVMIMMGMLSLIGEYLKVNGVADHVETELNRAVNLAIKESMHDSYRQDFLNKLDEDIARNGFYNYLHDDLELNDGLEKHQVGQRTYAYKIAIKEMEIDPEHAKMRIKAVAYVPCFFVGLPDWELPVNVTSRNMRVDGK